MSPDDRTRLVSGWIEHFTRRVVRDENNVFRKEHGQDNFWAFEQLDDICRENAELCWELILQVHRTPHHESVDESLAAGPLEDLLARYGPAFIDRVEELANADPKFRDLLGGVWKNDTRDDIWARVEAIRGHPW